MKKKLSIITLSLSSGGTERFIVNILPQLMNDFDVHLYFLFKDFHYPIPEGVKVSCFSEKQQLSRSHKLISFIQIANNYYRFLKKNKIDISVSFLPVPNFVNGLMNMLLPNIKCVLSERNFPTNIYQTNKAYSFLIPFFYNKADLVFSNSVYINQDLKENFKVTTPMSVVYNPVKPQEKIVRNTSKTFHIINVGSFQPYKKNQTLLLKAVKILRNIVPFHVHFVGEGERKELLIQQAKDFLLEEQTTFHGKTLSIFEKYKQADIFVLTSNSEGFPNALLEAMSIGLPIISTNCMSGPLEMLNENASINIPKYEFVIAKYGVLINLNDDIALAKAIKFLYNNPDIYKELSSKSYERSKDFAIDNIYNTLYHNILN